MEKPFIDTQTDSKAVTDEVSTEHRPSKIENHFAAREMISPTSARTSITPPQGHNQQQQQQQPVNPYEDDDIGDLLAFSPQQKEAQLDSLHDVVDERAVAVTSPLDEDSIQSKPYATQLVHSPTRGNSPVAKMELDQRHKLANDDLALDGNKTTESAHESQALELEQDSSRIATLESVEVANNEDDLDEMEFAVDQPEQPIEQEVGKSKPLNPLAELNNYRTDSTPRDDQVLSKGRLAAPSPAQSFQTEPAPFASNEKSLGLSPEKDKASSKMTLQEKVFIKLNQEEANQYCFDCGWANPTHVSINHGVFLCENCAIGIHIQYYPVEVSYIKSIEESNFNYLQLRVLINGGNEAALEFFEVYDLQNEPVQKRYNSAAAQFYRERLKSMHDQSVMSFGGDTNRKAPSFEEGRQAQKNRSKLTPQNVPFSNLNHRDILLELLSWETIDEEKTASSQDQSSEGETVAPSQASHLLSKFDKYMQEKEDQNTALHERIKKLEATSFKTKKQAQAALDALPAPDPSFPPFPVVENEPFGDANAFKFNDEVVFEKLNEFANSTYQIGESLLRRITLPDFFSRSTQSDHESQSDKKEAENTDSDNSDEISSPRDQTNSGQQTSDQIRDSIDSSGVGMSVLAGRGADRSQTAGAGAAANANQTIAQQRINQTKDRLISAGKSLWGYFTSAAQQVQQRGEQE